MERYIEFYCGVGYSTMDIFTDERLKGLPENVLRNVKILYSCTFSESFKS